MIAPHARDVGAVAGELHSGRGPAVSWSRDLTAAERFGRAGFFRVETGGGCAGYRRDMGDGTFIFVTDEDAHTPDSIAEPLDVGVYVEAPDGPGDLSVPVGDIVTMRWRDLIATL